MASAIVAVVLSGCTPGPVPPTPEPTTGSTPTPATGQSVTMADAARCPVTKPSRFAPPPGVAEGILFGAESSHGNGQLWVGGLGKDGVIVAGPDFVESDGSIGIKFGWYRVATGQLSITGRRLDGDGPPARASVPDGYGGTGFQSSGVHFPTEGCWAVTGTVGPTALTFVTFVIKGQ
jgi:hypothetical protein